MFSNKMAKSCVPATSGKDVYRNISKVVKFSKTLLVEMAMLD